MRVDCDGNQVDEEIESIFIEEHIEIQKESQGLGCFVNLNSFEAETYFCFDKEDAKKIIKGLQLAIDLKWLDPAVREVKEGDSGEE